MAKKRLNTVTKVTTAGGNDYIVMNASDGKTVQIKRADFANVMADIMRVATDKQHGLENKVYAQSNTFELNPGEEVDTGVAYGLITVKHPSTGNTIAALFGHFISYTQLIALAGPETLSIENKKNTVYVYKDKDGGNIKIKNNFSEGRTISYHIL